MKHLIAVDLETTGLDPNYNEIIEIGAIILDEDLVEMDRFHRMVRPLYPQRAINKGFNAFARSHIDPLNLELHPFIHTIITEFNQWLLKHNNLIESAHLSLLGQNIKFDYSFLQAAYEAANIYFPFDYHAISIESIYVALYTAKHNCLPDKISLINICEELQIEFDSNQHHGALYDIEKTIEAFKDMLAIVKTSGDIR